MSKILLQEEYEKEIQEKIADIKNISELITKLFKEKGSSFLKNIRIHIIEDVSFIPEEFKEANERPFRFNKGLFYNINISKSLGFGILKKTILIIQINLNFNIIIKEDSLELEFTKGGTRFIAGTDYFNIKDYNEKMRNYKEILSKFQDMSEAIREHFTIAKKNFEVKVEEN